MKHRPWILIAIALSSFAASGARADRRKRQPKHVAKVAIEAARATALAQVPGVIRHEELEREHRRWIYSFEIKPTGETKKIIKEVNVDADSGAVVDVDTEHE
jgi:uncharacterized membrane protein YkoI